MVSNIKKKFDCVLRVEVRLLFEIINFKSFDYDPEADVIRITGKNATENKYLKLG